MSRVIISVYVRKISVGWGSPGSTCRKVPSVGHSITQITTFTTYFILPVIGLLLPCAGQHLLELYRHVSSIWRTVLGCQNKIMCILSTEVQALEIFLNSSIWLHWQACFPAYVSWWKANGSMNFRCWFKYRKSHVGLPAWLQRAVLHREGAAAQMEPLHSNQTCGSTMEHAWVGIKAISSHSTGRETSAPSLATTRILA